MKKYAWTLSELIIATVIMGMLGALCVNFYKPNIQKAKFFAYAGISNLTKGLIAVIEKEGSILEGKTIGADERVYKDETTNIIYDWLCVQLADVFSLKTAAVCQRNTAQDTVNIAFPSGMTIKGLASAWQRPYDGSEFYYKNILLDIDGDDGVNKIGIDRFPLRIIGGYGKGTEGMIMPVNCADDKVFNKTNLVAVAANAKNPYCPATGGKNHTMDDQIITYDIYKPESKEEDAEIILVAASQPPMVADCRAYGDGQGYFSVAECNAASIKVSEKCATKEGCSSYMANTYPGTSNNLNTCKTLVATSNPDDISCFAIMHKPSIGGMSFVIQGLVGDID